MDDEQELETDDTDELFDWMANVFDSGGTDLSDYSVTIESGTITSISDSETTINLT